MKNRTSMNLLGKYAILYKKNPRSRVFAPLAEAYRKIGLHKDALKVLEKGIRFHPTYLLGYIVLAHCYFDTKQFELAYSTLRPFISQHQDNLSLLKLYADICMEVGAHEEALDQYKIILFINPHDKYSAKQVKLLEDDLQLKKIQHIEEIKIKQGTYEPGANIYEDEDSWAQVDFYSKNQSNSDQNLDEENEWEMNPDKRIERNAYSSFPSLDKLAQFKEEVKHDQIKLNPKDLDDDYFSSSDYSYGDEEDDKISEDVDQPKSNRVPFINHTLVDLYLSQNLKQQAIEVLESILKLHPTDIKTKQRLSELTSGKEISLTSHEKLLNLVDNSVHFRKQKNEIESAFAKFHQTLKLTAERKRHEKENNYT